MSNMWERLSKMLPGKEEHQVQAFQAIKRRGPRRYRLGDIVRSPEDVADLLALAAGQRGPCQMDLARNNRKYTFPCDYLVYGRHSLALIYPNDGKQIALQPGVTVTVYFQVRHLGKPYFYSFTAPIAAAQKQGPFAWAVVFAVPYEIECRQRRGALRISPDPGLIRRLMVWPMPVVKSGLRSDPVGEWGKPLVIYIAGKTEHSFIKDLSASGIRLQLPQRRYADKIQALSTGAGYAALLSLCPIRGAEGDNLILAMSVKNQRTSEDMRHIEIGAQFVAVSQPPQNIEDEVVWADLRYKDGTVERLARWITAWSLEELRKVNKFDF